MDSITGFINNVQYFLDQLDHLFPGGIWTAIIGFLTIRLIMKWIRGA